MYKDYYVRLLLGNKSFKNVVMRVENVGQIYEIINKANEDVDKDKYYKIIKLDYIECFESKGKIQYSYTNLSGNIIKNTVINRNRAELSNDIKCLRFKLLIKKKTLKQMFEKRLIYTAISLITFLPFFITVLNMQKQNILLEIFQDEGLTTVMSAKFISNVQLFLLQVFVLGFFILIMGIELKYLLNTNDDKMNKFFKMFFLSSFLVIIILFMFVPISTEEKMDKFVITCLALYVFFFNIFIQDLIKGARLLYAKYMKLSNKEQLTIGVSFITFILGLLIGK